MRRLAFGLVLTLVLSPTAARAQHRAGVAFSFSDPRQEFDANTDTGYGASVWYRYAIMPSGVLSIGVDGTFQQYGSTERRAPLSTTIPDIRVDVDTSNHTSFLMGAVEVEAPTGRLRPYAVATGGFGFLFTTTSLQNPLTDETVLTDTNKSDWTWMWGGGGGLRFQVSEQARLGGRPPARISLDLGATRLSGGEVEYLREGTLVTDEGEFDIDQRLARSEVDLFLYHLGVTFEF